MDEKPKGLLSEDAAPIKVAIVPKLAEVKAKDERQSSAPPAPKPALALGDDEEEENVVQKKKRAMVKLELEQSLDAAEENARRTARLVEISKRLPSSRSIFKSDINWDILNNVSVTLESKLTCSPAHGQRL